MSHHMRSLCAWIGVAALASPSLAQVLFQPLGSLPGRPESVAWDVSADGQWVVGTARSSGENEAFRWSTQTGMLSLGSMTPPPLESHGMAVSGDGSVIGGNAASPASPTEVYRWTQPTGMKAIGLAPGVTASLGSAVSDDGIYSVGWEFANPMKAFRWSHAGGYEYLGALPGGNGNTIPTSTSADGNVIMGVAHAAAGGVAFRWTPGTGIQEFKPAAFDAILPEGVSATGESVVGSFHPPGITSEAFLWSDKTGFVRLGHTPSSPLNTSAYDVTPDGNFVVGGGASSGVLGFAFFWSPQTGITDLREFLEFNGINMTGWALQRATGVSADGSTIVGFGLNPAGVQEAWVVTIPAPTTVLPLVCVATGFAARRKRARKYE